MRTIKKTFKTIKAAANYQGNLYNRYNRVMLISFPRFGESGVYIFQVSN